MVDLLEKIGAPATIITVVAIGVLVIAAIKEFQNSFATVKKVIDWFKTKFDAYKAKRKAKKELASTLLSMQKFIKDYSGYYTDENIEKRNKWMKWVDGKAEEYNKTLDDINKRLESLDTKLEKTTNLSEKTRLDQQRQAILDFAARANNPQYEYSKEHYRKIFRTIEEYEAYIEANNLINGEVDHAIGVIEKAYEEKKNSGKIVW